MFSLSRISTYPVDLLPGVLLSHIIVNKSTSVTDTQFRLITATGEPLSIKQFPQLFLIRPTVLSTGLMLTLPTGESMVFSYESFTSKTSMGHTIPEPIADIEVRYAIDPKLNFYFQTEVILQQFCYSDYKNTFLTAPNNLTFTQGTPYTCVNQASFDFLQEHALIPFSLSQFRPHLLVNGALAFTEERWQRVRIGEIIFEVIDVQNERSNSVLFFNESIVQQLTTTTGLINISLTPFTHCDFGLRLVPQNSGILRQGSRVEILEYRSELSFQRSSANTLSFMKRFSLVKSVTITCGTKKFVGENHTLILEQLEQHNIPIRSSCRAGICGQCQVQLLEGSVTPLKTGAIREGDIILTCSCTANSDLVLALPTASKTRQR